MKRLGHALEKIDERIPGIDLPLMSVSQTRGVIRRSELTDTPQRAESLDAYKVCRAGDIVFNKMKIRSGAMGVTPEDGLVTYHYEVMRLRDAMDARYIVHLMKSSWFTSELIARERGISAGGEYGGIRTTEVPFSVLRTIEVRLPEVCEQRRIADYLDRETALIDTLIEEQQCLIEMLRGRRKAVTEQAVFSGLDGAPARSNAEPWLPQTPCHWRVVQLGFVSDTLAGYAFPSDGFSTDEDHVRLLRGVNVKPGEINWTDTVYWDVEGTSIPSEFDLEVGDIVFGMDRPFVGGGVRVAAISGEDLPALLLQRVMRIRPNDEVGCGYMRYVMSTDAFFNYLEPLFTGVSVPHVSEWQVRKFKMPFPPIDEQKSIAAYLDEQVVKIDSLIEESERFVELARERRAALITAAVTGQIDVGEMV